jgi:pSer/pThr/pTyr-binding forkhead associated (FHA) protein
MGERITVTSPVCTLGRADGNGVQVNDSQLASVSRVHCTFQFSGDRWYLHDNKSTNGTWRRLSCVLEPSVPVPLDHGVAIQAGTHQFEVEVFSTPFAILPSVLQEVMLKLFGTGGQRLNTSAGRGPLLGPPGREKNDGDSGDGENAASARSAPPGSVDVSVNATVGSHEAA